MKVKLLTQVLAASTSVFGLAAAPALAGDVSNVPGIISRAVAEDADYVSVLSIPQGLDAYFGADIFTDNGVAYALVDQVRGPNGGAVRQIVNVEDGNGGAILKNDYAVTIKAVASTFADDAGAEVSVGAEIKYAVRQDVEVDDDHSIELGILNRGVLNVTSSATGSFAPSDLYYEKLDHVAYATIHYGIKQHAKPDEDGSSKVALENALGGNVNISASAGLSGNEISSGEDDSAGPARSATAVALISRPISQRAWGVDASALIENAGAYKVHASAIAADANKVAALSAIETGFAQDVLAKNDGEAHFDNSGSVEIAAEAKAIAHRRADAHAVVKQGVAQNVLTGHAGNAVAHNAGAVIASADAVAVSERLAKADAAVGQVIGQYVQSDSSSASIENSQLVKGVATATAASGELEEDSPVDRAIAKATVGSPKAKMSWQVPEPDESVYHDGDDADEESVHYHANLSDFELGPLAGLSQVAIGSTAEITNHGQLEFGAEAAAVGINLARASASATGVVQIADGNLASASYEGSANSGLAVSGTSDASADIAVAKAYARGVEQQAHGVEQASTDFASNGVISVLGISTAKGGSVAAAKAVADGVGQSAEGNNASANLDQGGRFNVSAQARSVSQAAVDLPSSDEQLLQAVQLVLMDSQFEPTREIYAGESAESKSVVHAGIQQSVLGDNATAEANNTGQLRVTSSAIAAGAQSGMSEARLRSGVAQVAEGITAEVRASNSGVMEIGAAAIGLSESEAVARSKLAVGVLQDATGDTASANFENMQTGALDFYSISLARGESASASAEIGFGIEQDVHSASSSAVFKNSGTIDGNAVSIAVDLAGEEGSANATAAVGSTEEQLTGALVTQHAVGSTVSFVNSGSVHSQIAALAQAASANSSGAAVVVYQAAEGEDAQVTAENKVNAVLESAGSVNAEGTQAASSYQGATLVQTATGESSSVTLKNSGTISSGGMAGAQGVESANAYSTVVAVQQSAYGAAPRVFMRNSGSIAAESAVNANSENSAMSVAVATGYRAVAEEVVLDVANSKAITADAFGRSSHDVAVDATAAEFVARDGAASISGVIANSGSIIATARADGANVSAVATGVKFTSGVNNTTFVNTGLIQADVNADRGADRIATGVLVVGEGEEPATGVFTFNNNGGSIISRVREGGATGLRTLALAPLPLWYRATAIDTRSAPNATVLNFNGVSSVYGNIDISGDDLINVRTGELTLEGVINADRQLLGRLEVQNGATLYLVDPVNRSLSGGYAYEGASKVNVDALKLHSGSTLAIQLPSNSRAPLAEAEYSALNANTAELAGTLELRLPTPNGLYDNYFFDNVIDADTRTGKFDKLVLSVPSALLQLEARYDNGNNVDLLINRIGFGAVQGLTYNQTQTGNGIEKAYSPTQTGPFATLLANLFSIAPSSYANALDQLSGAEYASYMQATRNLSQQISTNVSDQLTCSRDKEDKCWPKNGVRLFLMPGYGSTSVDFDGNSSGYKADGAHILFGAGYGSGPFSIAAFGGYRKVDVRFDRFGNEAKSDGWQGGLLVNLDGRDVYARANANFSQLQGEIERNIRIGTTVGQAEGDLDANVFAFNAEIGGRIRAGNHLFSPFAAFDYASIKLADISEEGVPDANLTLKEQTQDQASMLLGLKWALQAGNIVPELKVAYRHDFNNEVMLSHAFFSAAPASSFAVRSPFIGNDSAMVGGSLTAAFGKKAFGRIGYLGRFNSQAHDHAVYGALILRFGGQ